jgi:hypothetical protein
MALAAGASHILELTKKALKEAGATSEETAKTPEELKLDERWRVAWLKMSANTIIPSGVIATKDGRYYLISKNEKKDDSRAQLGSLVSLLTKYSGNS